MSLDAIMNEFESREKLDSDFFKLQEGQNKIRLLTDFVKVETVTGANGKYKGLNYAGRVLEQGDKVSMKGWAWSIDRASGDLKIVQFGKTILGQIVALRNDADYQFADFPMPYDITINAKGAGTMEVEYTVTPARQNTDVTDEEISMLVKKKSISDIVLSIIDKQTGKTVSTMKPAENNTITKEEEEKILNNQVF